LNHLDPFQEDSVQGVSSLRKRASELSSRSGCSWAWPRP